MFQITEPDVQTSTFSHADSPSIPDRQREPVRHLLFGSPRAIQITIKHLHKLGYADPNDWSKPIPTGRPREVMAILTKYV